MKCCKKLHKTWLKTRIFNGMKYRFADLMLDTGRRQLSRGDEKISLTRLSYRVLRTLLEAAPDMVSPDELVDRSWGSNRVVTPENINQRIMLLRQSLGDDAQHPRYVEAVRGQGFRLIPNVEEHPLSFATGSNPAFGIRNVVVAAVVLGLLAWFLSVQWYVPDGARHPGSNLESLPEINLLAGPSVAVLPFLNMSRDPQNEYLSDGISEELINTLVQQTTLPIIGRTSSFQFKDQQLDLKAIGERLGATHLVEGSVRKSGQQIRITAQLIDSSSGVHLWSEEFDRSIEDLFEVQTEIAGRIVEKIQWQLQSQGEFRLDKIIDSHPADQQGLMSPAAYDAYLQGLQYKNRMLPEDIRKALQYFNEAARLSPESLSAWEALIDTQLLAASYEMALEFPVNAYDNIEGWLETARAYHPDAAYLVFMNGMMQAVNQLRWREGVADMERALPQLQNNASALAWAGWVYLMLERIPQAEEALDRALEISPHSPAFTLRSFVYLLTGNQTRALEVIPGQGRDYLVAVATGSFANMTSQPELLDKAIRTAKRFVDPSHTTIRSMESLYAAVTGNRQKAMEISSSLLEGMRQKPVNILMLDGRTDAYIEEAIRQRQGSWVYFSYLNRESEKMKPWVKAFNLEDFPEPDLRARQLSPAEQEKMLSAEWPVDPEHLQAYAGRYGTDQRSITIRIDSGRLAYKDRSWSGLLVATGEHTFESLDERKRSIEFVPNNSGQIDLCFWTRGELKFFGYRQEPGPNLP